jgi:antitoxin HicB
MKLHGYDVEVQNLRRELGGGFVAFAPALKGCIADGESREEALRHLEDAISCWLAAATEKGRETPLPDTPDQLRGGREVPGG